MNRFLAAALVMACAVTGTFADPGQGAMIALNALPAKYRAGIVKLSADNGTPEPESWYILAKNSADKDELYSISIVGGQVAEEKLSLDLRALFSEPSAIDPSKITVDSGDAWMEAEKYTALKHKTLGSVSYVLEQKGMDAEPIWSLWCYDPDGEYIGLLKVIASTGKILSRE